MRYENTSELLLTKLRLTAEKVKDNSGNAEANAHWAAATRDLSLAMLALTTAVSIETFDQANASKPDQHLEKLLDSAGRLIHVASTAPELPPASPLVDRIYGLAEALKPFAPSRTGK